MLARGPGDGMAHVWLAHDAAALSGAASPALQPVAASAAVLDAYAAARNSSNSGLTGGCDARSGRGDSSDSGALPASAAQPSPVRDDRLTANQGRPLAAEQRAADYHCRTAVSTCSGTACHRLLLQQRAGCPLFAPAEDAYLSFQHRSCNVPSCNAIHILPRRCVLQFAIGPPGKVRCHCSSNLYWGVPACGQRPCNALCACCAADLELTWLHMCMCVVPCMWAATFRSTVLPRWQVPLRTFPAQVTRRRQGWTTKIPHPGWATISRAMAADLPGHPVELPANTGAKRISPVAAHVIWVQTLEV
jgi:hypothetical protein